MAGTIKYGTQTFQISDDEQLQVYRLMIRRIVESGKTEWLPLRGDQTHDLLITAGVPVTVSVDTESGVAETLETLVQRYINDYPEEAPQA